jgi:hypothetical protein
MATIRKILIAAALAVSTLAPVATVEAAPLGVRDLSIDRKTDVTDARWVVVGCNRWGRRCRRAWRPGRVWIAPRVIIAPRVVVRRGYNAHVRWCLARYRSYNPATNLYIGYDGYGHRCLSPYR